MHNNLTKLITTIAPISRALMLSMPISAVADLSGAAALPSYTVPTYTCVRNWYLSPTGSDSNAGNSSGSPWRTMQKADANVRAGDCVNLAAGTYNQTTTINLRHGGNANTPTGYVVYRSTTPHGAHIFMATQQPVNQDLINITNNGTFNQNANYVILDGLDLDGNNGFAPGVCVGTYPAGNHHLIIENSLIHGCGSSGVGLANGEYYWIVNNAAYNNSNTDSFNEGSGLDVYEPSPASLHNPSFVPNANDQALHYHIVFANNTSYNNIVLAPGGTNGGSSHTDGNGIILDDWNHTQCNDTCTPYTQPALVEGNTTYSNGGAGIIVYQTQNATVANNSAYNNFRDTLNFGTQRGDIACAPCSNSTFINNASYAVVGSGVLANNHAYNGGGTNVTWTTNIGYPGNSGTFTGSGNLFNTDPKFNNPSAGDFSLQAGSRAIGSATPEPWLNSGTPNMGAWQSTSRRLQ